MASDIVHWLAAGSTVSLELPTTCEVSASRATSRIRSIGSYVKREGSTWNDGAMSSGAALPASVGPPVHAATSPRSSAVATSRARIMSGWVGGSTKAGGGVGVDTFL